MAFGRASSPNWGQRGPTPLGLGEPDLGAEARVGSGERPRVRAGPRGRLPPPREAAVGVRGSLEAPTVPVVLCYWLPRPRLAMRPPRARLGPESGAGSETSAEPAVVVKASRGQGRPRGRRPGTRAAARRSPLPPSPGSAASFPPPAWRAAAATARAAGGARNGARLAASPGGGERGSPGARRPRARGPPQQFPRPPSDLGLCGLRDLGARPGEGPPSAPGPQRQPGKERGRKEEEGGRHLATGSPARPPACPPAPAPAPGPG